jgi:hypothetical protein
LQFIWAMFLGYASRAPSSTSGMVDDGEGEKVTKPEIGVNGEFSTGGTTGATRRFHIGENATGKVARQAVASRCVNVEGTHTGIETEGSSGQPSL